MGFEQLAALKQQLEAQRQKEKPPARKRATSRQAPKPTEPVDPVVISISRLQRHFPATFPKRPAPKLPLKLGVHKDLVEQAEVLGLTPEQIKEAVKTWCEGARYWACVTEGAPRIDLTGAQNGAVTAPEAQRAKYLLSRRRRRPTGGKTESKAAAQPSTDSGEKRPADPTAKTSKPDAPGDAPPAVESAPPGEDV